MKKNLFMVAAVALMAMVSCNKEEIGNNGVEGGQVSDIVFSAELEQPDGGAAVAPAAAQTKTSLGEAVGGVRPVTWNAGDKIKVNGVEFSATAAGSRTDFTTTESFTEAETYYAVYPASAAGASDLTKVTIPASQKGTFAEAAISVAKSNTQSLSFKNVASILKFQVPDACSEVTIESTANLAGTVSVKFTNERPEISSVTGGSKKITLTGSFATGKDYYVAVLPESHKFTIRIGGYLSKASTTAVTTKRAVISNLKALPAPTQGTYKLMGLNGDWDNGIKFYKDVDGYLLQDVVLTASSEFKFCQEGGAWGRTISLVKDKWLYTYPGDGNLKMTAGTYDIWASAANNAVCIVNAGSAMPAFTSANKQLYILVEGDGEQGLHMWEPSVPEYNNWDSAWKNYNGQVKIDQSSNKYTDYYYYQLPTIVNDKTCKFLVKWYGGNSKDYEMLISTDLPFWRKGNDDKNGSYQLSSKIDIK